jgi:hypothetical protein
VTSEPKRKIVVVGSEGRLAKELRNQLVSANIPFEVLGMRRLARSFIANERASKRFAQSWGENILVIWASGLINPLASRSELQFVNYELPSKFLSHLRESVASLEFVSVGSVLESFESVNNYIQSKKSLYYWLQSEFPGNAFVHIRTHTLVNESIPPSHMFLGLLAKSLADGGEFRMSEGLQFRQYIEFRVLVKHIVGLLSGPMFSESGIQYFGGSKPVQLRTLVEKLSVRHNPKVKLVFDASLNPSQDFYNQNLQPRSMPNNLEDSLSLITRLMPKWIEQHMGK